MTNTIFRTQNKQTYVFLFIILATFTELNNLNTKQFIQY